MNTLIKRVFFAISFGTSTTVLAETVPELQTGWTDKSIAYAEQDMVSAAHPLAASTGNAILKKGGSAVDAAIAMQMVLNLVEPQSSGIGGGAFMLYFDAKKRAVQSYDGRETAPASATAELFLDEKGQPLTFNDAAVGGRSVGTPGLLRMLELVHKQHGRLPWKVLFTPAIQLAQKGFPISPRMARLLAADQAIICNQAPAKEYFCYPDGTAKKEGTLLKNPELANTFTQIADQGADAFYSGKIAEDIVHQVQHHPTNPGGLTIHDMSRYQAKEREPVCSTYRLKWKICGMGMPSSGGTTTLQVLGIAESFDLTQLLPNTVPAIHAISEAYRLAYSDRSKYMADSDFVSVPQTGLLDKNYLASRAMLIDTRKSMGIPQAGIPPQAKEARGIDNALELPSTTHLSVVDKLGNAVSMTSSIEAGFGSRQWVRGFLLNNQLTDFSFTAKDSQGNLVANRVEPGKRPRSSMSPTMVFDENNRLKMVIGSAGGASIIQHVTKTIIGVLDWNMGIQEAIDLGHFGAMTSPTTVLELGNAVSDRGIADGLRVLGHTISIIEQNSGLHGITLQNGTTSGKRLIGAADPRREGIALGN